MALKLKFNPFTSKLDWVSEEDLSSYLKLDQTTPQSVINGVPYIVNGIKTPKIYPNTDSTTAIQFNKADGTTNVLNIDTTNGFISVPLGCFGIGGAAVSNAGLYCNVTKVDNNVYGAYYNTTWTPTSGGAYTGYGFIQTLSANGSVDISALYTGWSRLLIGGSGNITGDVCLYYGELKSNSTTKTIAGNVFLFRAATTLSGSKSVVSGYSYQLYLGDMNTAFDVATAKRFGIVQQGSTNVNYFQSKIQIVSDSQGLELGASKDASIHYNATDLIINPKVVGSGKLDVLGVLQTDGYNAADGSSGVSGSFTTVDLKTVTVKDGLVVQIT